MGIGYHALHKYTLEQIERIEKELQQMSIPSVDENKEPTLMIYSSDDKDN